MATHVKNSLVRKKKIRSNPQLLYDFVVENHLSQLSMFTDHDDSKSNLMKVFGHISYMLMKTKYKDYIRKFNENVFTLEEQDQMINEVDDFLQKNNNQVSSEFRKIALEHPVTRLGKHFLEVWGEDKEFNHKIFGRKGTKIKNEAEFKKKLNAALSRVDIAR